MSDDARALTRTTHGRLQGAWHDGVATFQAVPYAAPPLGALRFRPPQPAAPWDGVRQATTPAAIPAQNPSRLARVLGDYDLAQSEDCLTVNVITPGIDDAARPVLVWLHGGAFLTGGNAIDWYDGTPFARDHGLVFVGVNYRLGAFGYLRAEGLGDGNQGLLDQLAALQWVQENIAAFGGDPGRVTVVGQSAGAMSTLCLLAMRQADGLFQRAVLQSGRFSALGSAADAEASGEALVQLSGVPADAFRALPTAAILELQARQIRAGAAFGMTSTPFQPIADGDVLPTDTLDASVDGASRRDVMIGWTRDEMAAFYAGSPDILAGTAGQVESLFRDLWGNSWREGMAFARARVPGASQDRLLDAGINECMFAGSAIALAERLAPRRAAWLYRFDWAAPGNPFGACHCIELPFVFANTARWQAPMLAGADAAGMAALAAGLQAAWAAFVRDGDPNHAGLPAWPRYQAPQRWTLRIDHTVETVGDLAGVSLPGRPWPQALPLER